MSKILENNIRNSLKNVMYPKTGKDIVSEGIISPLIIKEGKVIFSLNMIHEDYGLYEAMKKHCESIVSSLDGVDQVSIAITKHQSSNPQPSKHDIKGVKNIIIVASGKGGVGKSTVSVNLAIALARLGFNAGIVDADIYGPSIPIMMGTNEKPLLSDNDKMIPIERHGIKSNSIGYMMDSNGALVWRGAMITKAIQQLLLGTDWAINKELDYLIIDTPPGTGDIHITLAKNFNISGAVIVGTPQNIAISDVRKVIDMYKKVNIPILGVIENMSYLKLEGSDSVIYPFGQKGCSKLADEYKIPLLDELPLDAKISDSVDNGQPAYFVSEEISKKMTNVASLISKV